MKAHKFKILIILISFLFIGAVAWLKFNQKMPKYIFINQTNDHRFDESIQVSIIAATKRSNVQNAVVILDNEKKDIDQNKLAVKIFKQLHLGKNNNGRAILYLFSPKTKSLKIEVSYPLEGILTDAKIHMLESAAKSFIYESRYNDFWGELINTLNIEIEKGSSHSDLADFKNFEYLSGGAGIYSPSYSGTIDQFEKEFNKLINVDDPQFAESLSLETTLNQYLLSLNKGIGSTNLPMLSIESKIFRSFTPLTRAQLHRNWKMYNEAGLDKIIYSDGLAFVFYRKGHPIPPIVFKKVGAFWKVQEALSWSLFSRFEDSMNVFLKFPLIATSKELNDYLEKKMGKAVYPLALKIELSKLNLNPQNLNSLELANHYFFNYYWLEKSWNFYNSLKPIPNNLLWLGLELQTQLGKFSDFLLTYKKLSEVFPKDAQVLSNYKFYSENFVFTGKDWLLEEKFDF